MPGHIASKDPTREYALDALSKKPIIDGEANRLSATVRNYVRLYGPLELCDDRGKPFKFVYNQQTITSVPNPTLVMRALEQLYGETDPRALRHIDILINKLSIRQWPGFYRGLDKDMMGELSAKVEYMDKEQEGGMVEVYGKAEIRIRSKPPEPGRHWVVMPGDEPRVTEGFQQDPEEEE